MDTGKYDGFKSLVTKTSLVYNDSLNRSLVNFILGAAERLGVSVYVYGYSDDINSKIVKKFPEFVVVEQGGVGADGSFNANETGDFEKIIKSGAGSTMLILSAGVAKKEEIDFYRSRMNAVLLTVPENILLLLTEVPRWMENVGLEWFYHLLRSLPPLIAFITTAGGLFAISQTFFVNRSNPFVITASLVMAIVAGIVAFRSGKINVQD